MFHSPAGKKTDFPTSSPGQSEVAFKCPYIYYGGQRASDFFFVAEHFFSFSGAK